MKVYQLYVLAVWLLVAMVSADEGAAAAPDCSAECQGKVDETWVQANGEINGLREELKQATGQAEEAQRGRDEVNRQLEETAHARNEATKGRDEVQRALDETRNALEQANADKASLEQHLSDAKGQAQAAKSEAQQANSKIAALEKQLKSGVAAEQAKVKAAQSEVKAAKEEVAKYSEARFLINMDLIQSDAKDFLAKMGIGSSKEDL